MSEELKNTTNKIMSQLRKGKYKMRPRAYFIMGSLLVVIGLVTSFAASVFFTSLVSFVLREGGYNLGQLFSDFPWWAPTFAILGLFAGIGLIRKYDFSYKIKSWVVIAGVAMMVLVAGWGVDASGLDKVWLDRGPIQGIMKKYRQENRAQEKNSQFQGQKQIQNQGQNQNQPEIKNKLQSQSQGQSQVQPQGQMQNQNQNQTEIQETGGNNNAQENGQESKKMNNPR